MGKKVTAMIEEAAMKLATKLEQNIKFLVLSAVEFERNIAAAKAYAVAGDKHNCAWSLDFALRAFDELEERIAILKRIIEKSDYTPKHK